MSVNIWLVIGFAFAVLTVLVMGVTSMMVGGKFNQKYGNKLMVARVVLQALTLGILALFFAHSATS